MTHGSLFSGIGGFDLAAEWMGWDNKFSCEINPFGRKVLEYYWPNATHYEDITTTDFTIWRGRIDVLTGGFPCQPFSQAGKRKGTEDDRHLWPRMLEVIREVQPIWVVGENVYGLTNWDGGLVFEQVCLDLENEGYEVQPVILPAVSVNAPHRRDRVWFVAHARDKSRRSTEGCKDKQGRELLQGEQQGSEVRSEDAGCCGEWPTPNTNGLRGTQEHELQQSELHKQHGEGGTATDTSNQRLQGGKFDGTPEQGRDEQKREGKGQSHESASELHQITDWRDFPTQSPICSRDDGLSSRLDFDAVWEGVNPRKPYITFSKWRNESIKAYGNAIVPQVVYEIFKVIEQIHNDN